jgi:simple sugar transport system ATP-binding protein
MTPVLELKNITKGFPGVLANDHIDLTLEPGEVHALLGENGAGKSTLMNILYGLYAPDEGHIFVKGQPIDIRTPNDAIALGIGMVHQHFMLVPVFTVTENVMLGIETLNAGFFLDHGHTARRIREISKLYSLEIDPEAVVKTLPLGVQQRAEIIKLLYRNADILILDEPTAVLTPQEVEDLFKVIRSLKEQGKSIIFITHKLKEVMQIADRITVLRNGRVAGTAVPGQTNEAELASLMVGRHVLLMVEKGPATPQDVVLDIYNLTVIDDRGNPVVRGASLQVQAGEVVGIAGVQGNGQTELVQAIMGLRKIRDGYVSILGQSNAHFSPRQILELGVAHVPEDRQKDGLVLTFPISENLVLDTYYQSPIAETGMINNRVILDLAETRVKEFDVRTPSVITHVGSLSGGNQQKVIIAREFSRPIKLLVAAQPTRGLDVGSIEYIHKRIIQKRDEGCAVLVISSELDEVMGLADRIAVMYEGRIIDIVSADKATKEQIGLLMTGVHPD